jgi:hypothetical protein
MEVRQLRQELNNHMTQMQNLAGHASQPQTPLDTYPTDQYGRGIPAPRPDARAELPPLRSIGGPVQACPEGMTGVQYHQEQRAVNGYSQGYAQRI